MYRYIWKIKFSDPASEDKFITHWREASAILQEFDGALGTHLHRVRNEEGSFYAVAEWESQELRDLMQQEVEQGITERAKRWREFPKNETFGDIISFAGEEIEAVMPNKLQ